VRSKYETSTLALLNKVSWPAAFLIIAVCLLFTYRSLASGAWERIGEFATMRALGWRRRDIRQLLVLELGAYVTLGVGLGLALGALVAYLGSLWSVQLASLGLAPPLAGSASAPASVRLPALFPASLYAVALAVALAVGLFVAAIVAARVSALKPSDAWRRL
jgi:putative ABC transport system permease protein